MKYRLSLDVGTNSIGWAVVELNQINRPQEIIGSGVRIFSNSRDTKGNKSLAEQRRGPRGQRRNRDRYKKRRKEFMNKLVQHKFMPQSVEERKKLENKRLNEETPYETDPWVLRVNGLDKKLELFEFGRALFHLQQRRGFKSNRKTDKAETKDGKISLAAKELKARMEEAGARTVGEALAKERIRDFKTSNQHPVRVRLHGEGAKSSYDFYPLRDMVEEEFNKLWESQVKFHGKEILSAQAKIDLLDTLLFQRPLRAQLIGKCTLNPTEQRIASCLPTHQKLRIYQELNSLRFGQTGQNELPLTVQQRNVLAQHLSTTKEASFSAMAKKLKLPDGAYFNLESKKRKNLKGDIINILFSKPECFGDMWSELSLDQQDAIVFILIGYEPFLDTNKTQPNPSFESTAAFVGRVLDLPFGELSDPVEGGCASQLGSLSSVQLLQITDPDLLSEWFVWRFAIATEQSRAIVNITSHKDWPQGHGRLGHTVSREVLEQLTQNDSQADPETGEVYDPPFVYSQAVKLAGYSSHSDFSDGSPPIGKLPYYGKILERQVAFGTGNSDDLEEKRLGKIANPTVHVALNQIRRVVNDLIKTYGRPLQIIVETARELPLSAQGLADLKKEQSHNQKLNEKRSELLFDENLPNSYENRLRLKLWEELNPKNCAGRMCPYTGKNIGIKQLFSAEVEIEHILPYAITGDDAFSNKTVCFREANREKGDKSPYEAFGHSPSGYDWEEIVSRVSAFPNNKKWRFNPDAMERYDRENHWQDRYLNSTKYIARLTKDYLKPLGADVWVTPGQLTSDLRHSWGLNSVLAGHNETEGESENIKKNRDDHRHHAIDAIVIAMIDRGLLNEVSRNSARRKSQHESPLKMFKQLEPPIKDLRDQALKVIHGDGKTHKPLIVSHKADHGVQSQLMNETSYGASKTAEGKLVTRLALSDFETQAKLLNIVDENIKSYLMEQTEGKTGKEFKAALVEAGENHKQKKKNKAGGYDWIVHPIRKVRVYATDVKKETAIPICKKGQRQPYKYYKGDGNYCYEIFANSKGKWVGDIITTMEANQQSYDPKSKISKTGEPLIMRLINNDLVEMDAENSKTGRSIYYIVKQSKGIITIAEHLEANTDKRNRDPLDDFKLRSVSPSTLQKRRARKVHVSPSGLVRYLS